MVNATAPPRRDATVDGCCPHPWKRSVRSYGRQTCVLCECVTHRVRLWYVCTLGRDSALANGVRPRLGLCARALPVAYMSMSMYMYYSAAPRPARCERFARHPAVDRAARLARCLVCAPNVEHL
eukprot:373978-Prymnesium_polylepis.1